MDYVRYIIAFIFVIGLMLLLGWLGRRFIPGTIPIKTHKGKKRLGIVEMMALDAKRRLVLIKRDNKEHLIILGQNGETVIENNITPPSTNSGLDDTLTDKE